MHLLSVALLLALCASSQSQVRQEEHHQDTISNTALGASTIDSLRQEEQRQLRRIAAAEVQKQRWQAELDANLDTSQEAITAEEIDPVTTTTTRSAASPTTTTIRNGLAMPSALKFSDLVEVNETAPQSHTVTTASGVAQNGGLVARISTATHVSTPPPTATTATTAPPCSSVADPNCKSPKQGASVAYQGVSTLSDHYGVGRGRTYLEFPVHKTAPAEMWQHKEQGDISKDRKSNVVTPVILRVPSIGIDPSSPPQLSRIAINQHSKLVAPGTGLLPSDVVAVASLQFPRSASHHTEHGIAAHAASMAATGGPTPQQERVQDADLQGGFLMGFGGEEQLNELSMQQSLTMDTTAPTNTPHHKFKSLGRWKAEQEARVDILSNENDAFHGGVPM